MYPVSVSARSQKISELFRYKTKLYEAGDRNERSDDSFVLFSPIFSLLHNGLRLTLTMICLLFSRRREKKSIIWRVFLLIPLQFHHVFSSRVLQKKIFITLFYDEIIISRRKKKEMKLEKFNTLWKHGAKGRLKGNVKRVLNMAQNTVVQKVLIIQNLAAVQIQQLQTNLGLPKPWF